MVKDTCDFENCKFAKDFFEKPEECFNYKVTYWTPMEGGEPKIICDCAPIRGLIVQQDMMNMMMDMRKDLNKMANKSTKMTKSMMWVMEEITKNPGCVVEFNDTKLIEE